MPDFVEDLKSNMLKVMPDASPLWCEFCAIAPLATILHDAQIIEQERPMNLNLFMMMVAPPGIKKSLPMFSFTYPIIRRLCDDIDMNLLIPERYTVEGMISYVNAGGVGGVQRRDVGLIIRDEFSGLFKQLRKVDWQSDGVEFISEMYDGTYKGRTTVSHGYQRLENFYVSMLTATTPYFLSMMDNEFFIQGTGNRFMYCSYGMEKYKVQRIDWETYFNESWEKKQNDLISGNANLLMNLHRREIRKIYVCGGAELYADYKYNCELEWKHKGIKDPMGWSYHPIKRYPEIALKLAGLYAISARAHLIIKMSKERWDHSISIEKKHMERAIATIERSREHFEEIVRIKEKHIPRAKVETQENRAKAIVITLMTSKYGMLDAGQWFEAQIIAKSDRDFHMLRRACISQKYVDVLTFKDLTEEQKDYFGVDSHHVKFYKCAESMNE